MAPVNNNNNNSNNSSQGKGTASAASAANKGGKKGNSTNMTSAAQDDVEMDLGILFCGGPGHKDLFSFSASPFSTEALHRAEHDFELERCAAASDLGKSRLYLILHMLLLLVVVLLLFYFCFCFCAP